MRNGAAQGGVGYRLAVVLVLLVMPCGAQKGVV